MAVSPSPIEPSANPITIIGDINNAPKKVLKNNTVSTLLPLSDNFLNIS